MPGDRLTLAVHPEIAGLLLDKEHPAMDELEERRIRKRIFRGSQETLHLEESKISNEI